MRSLLVLAGLATIGFAGTAVAGGGPSIVAQPDPQPFTVVASGSGERAVHAPRRRTDATIDRAVRAAQAGALPAAIAAARRTADELARAARLRRGAIVAIRRDVAPPPYLDTELGAFGPGVWCGRIYTGGRTIHRADGTTRRVNRYRHGCRVPRTTTARVTVTFAATPAAG
jgi:hypothetical protein